MQTKRYVTTLRLLAFTSVAPTGGTGAYTYQWESSANNSTWAAISGATAATYTPTALTATTYYRRKATSGSCGTATSNTITVTVYGALTAGSVSANQTICNGSTPAAFTSVAPTGGTGTYTYQWESSANNSTWVAISGATSATYAPPVLTATTYYRRKASSGSCGTATSNTITVTVYGALTAGSIGSNQTICNGSTPAAFTSVAPTGGTGTYSYQWESSANNSTWVAISGATSATYAPTALTATTYYRRKATSGSCGTATSNTITVTVYGALTAGSIGANQTICNGSRPTAFTSVAPTGGTGTYSYQWESSANNSTWAAISGATSATYTPPVLTATTYYRRKATSGSCGTATSNTITVTVNPLPVLTKPDDQTVCYNRIAAAVNFAGTNVNATNCTWTNNRPDIGLSGSGTGDIPAFKAFNTGTSPIVATITVTPRTAAGCVGTVKTFTITVTPMFELDAIAEQFVRVGTTATQVFSGTGIIPANCNWTNSNPAIGLPASGSGNISFTATNTTNQPIYGDITVTTYERCASNSQTFTIIVNPACGAYTAFVSKTDFTWRKFMCHNLGADTSKDPYTPSKSINGNYYQWGRPAVVATADTPSGPISGWNTTNAPDQAWNSGTEAAPKKVVANDPCPSGFRVPTRTEWDKVLKTSANKKSWVGSITEFTTGEWYGTSLFLPATGTRQGGIVGGFDAHGELFSRDIEGSYWSSAAATSRTAYYLIVTSAGGLTHNGPNGASRAGGDSVRCISE